MVGWSRGRYFDGWANLSSRSSLSFYTNLHSNVKGDLELLSAWLTDKGHARMQVSIVSLKGCFMVRSSGNEFLPILAPLLDFTYAILYEFMTLKILVQRGYTTLLMRRRCYLTSQA